MIDRRTALASFIAMVGGAALPDSVRPTKLQHFYGWSPDEPSRQRYIARTDRPFLKQVNREIKGSGKGKKAFLHLAYERVTGQKYRPHVQGAPDCTAQAAALGVDFLSSVQIEAGKPEHWIAKTAVEPIYGGSRVEIGGDRRGPIGSTGHWTVEWLEKYGVLLRRRYFLRHDFTVYSGNKSKRYGREGVPDRLEPVAKRHPVRKSAICTTYEDMCDCIQNGSPVIVCSKMGFGDHKNKRLKRDRDGFLHRHRKPWWHAMLFAGYDDEFRRPGALAFNSWGDGYIEGPTRGPQPPGTFWIDARTVTAMLQQGDSFAISAYTGFPRTRIPRYILH